MAAGCAARLALFSSGRAGGPSLWRLGTPGIGPVADWRPGQPDALGRCWSFEPVEVALPARHDAGRAGRVYCPGCGLRVVAQDDGIGELSLAAGTPQRW